MLTSVKLIQFFLFYYIKMKSKMGNGRLYTTLFKIGIFDCCCLF